MSKTPPIDEKELLLRLQGGDKMIFGKVFKAYYAGMCRFAQQFVPDHQVIEDIVGDVFLKLLEDGQLFNGLNHLKAFLYRSVRHSCLDYLKVNRHREIRNVGFTEEYLHPETSYLAEIMRTEIMLELHQAIAGLPKQAGKVITLTYLEGKSNQETADAMGLALQTVKNQKKRGLELLRSRIPADKFLLLLTFSGIFWR